MSEVDYGQGTTNIIQEANILVKALLLCLSRQFVLGNTTRYHIIYTERWFKIFAPYLPILYKKWKVPKHSIV